MKMVLLAVGKNHEPFVKQGVEDFTRRISNYFPVEWLIPALPKQAAVLPEQELLKKEGRRILKCLEKDDCLVLLDERGKQWSSPELAGFVQDQANQSRKRLVFAIGGAFGADEAVKQRSDRTWSVSRLTFPHQLVRLILAEQLYRACTILRNEKYHHS